MAKDGERSKALIEAYDKELDAIHQATADGDIEAYRRARVRAAERLADLIDFNTQHGAE